jgi:hypothetical protein
MAQKQEMKKTSNIEHRTPNTECQQAAAVFDVGCSALGVRRLP